MTHLPTGFAQLQANLAAAQVRPQPPINALPIMPLVCLVYFHSLHDTVEGCLDQVMIPVLAQVGVDGVLDDGTTDAGRCANS